MELSDNDIRRLAVAAERAQSMAEVEDIPPIDKTFISHNPAWEKLFLQYWGSVVLTVAKGLEQLAAEKANPK